MSNNEAPQQFWLPDLRGEDLRVAAWGFADALWNSDRERERRTCFLVQASQYLGRPITSLTDFEEVTARPSTLAGVSGRTTRNLTKTLVDTALSRFAKTETRVQYLTNGGNEGEQEDAEEATDGANALLEQTGSEIELRKAALHACVFDLGIVKRVVGPAGPEVEHVPAWEVMFDPADAHRGKPSIRVQRFPGDREALIARFIAPLALASLEIEDPIERQRKLDTLEDMVTKLRQGGTTMVTPDHTQSDMHVIAYELWRDPVGKKKGRHVVVTDSVMLLDEEIEVLEQKNAPFVFFGFSEPLVGAYPESIAAIVSELQAELDGMKTRKSQILRLMAVPRYVVTGPDAEQLESQIRGGSDALGDIIKAPTGTTVTPLNLGLAESLTALTQEMNEAWQKGFEMVGINPSNAIGSRPTGLNSAPSQREWNEIAQDRLSLVALEYQQAHVDLATLLLDAVEDLPDYEIKIKSPNGKFLRKLKAADLKLGQSDYVLQRFPIGALPTTPTGKLAAAGDLLQMGALDKEEFQQIVQLPDLKSRVNINIASRQATEKLIAKMLRTGQYITPPDCLEPVYALKYATYMWLTGVASEGEPDAMSEDQLNMLQNWMDDLNGRLNKADQNNAPAPPVNGAAPAPGATPGDTVMGTGRVGGQPIALQPGGIAPLLNHQFAPPPGNGAQ